MILISAPWLREKAVYKTLTGLALRIMDLLWEFLRFGVCVQRMLFVPDG